VVTDLAAKGLRVQDGTHHIVSATIEAVAAGSVASSPQASGPATDSPAGAGISTVRVAVVDAMPAHLIVDTAGNPVGQTAARSEERRILVLESTTQGYRINSILAG
jgi:hypothetical protein